MLRGRIRAMGWQWPWLRKLRQPWLFIYYAVGFGGLMYLIERRSVVGAVVLGLVFATVMSILHEIRLRRTRAKSEE
jgi:hypothetical protein